jgi:hypothetical protein
VNQVAALAPPYLYLEPPVPPPLRPYGLFDVAAGPIPFPVDAAAAGGVMYQPNDCEDDVFIADGQLSADHRNGGPSPGIETAISGAPFSVYTSWQCSTIGYSFEEQAARVRTRLGLACAQTAVERRLWQGQTSATDGNFSGLFANAIPLPAAACVTEAVEMLEQTLADNGVFGGIIHARVGMAAHIGQAHLLETQGRMKTTPYGTPYVFWSGLLRHRSHRSGHRRHHGVDVRLRPGSGLEDPRNVGSSS